jgi:uncharacterized protein YheU (UPF0270 family)
VIIPHGALQPETLENLIREFVLREGTDYGLDEVPLKQKVAQIKSQLESGKLVVTYSEEYETCSIHPAAKFSS